MQTKTKFFVLNGHGLKISNQTFEVNHRIPIISTGPVENNYEIKLDNLNDHIERFTSQDLICKVIDEKTEDPVAWHKYEDTYIGDISITPLLQNHFSADKFYESVFNGTTGWERLSAVSHDVKKSSVLVVEEDGVIKIYRGKPLEDYLGNQKKLGSPLFFCDLHLGKIKPLAKIALSKIYYILPHILGDQSVGLILAVCNTNYQHAKEKTSQHLIIQTTQQAEALKDYDFIKPKTFVLKNEGGNNLVDSIETLPDGSYKIQGRTEKNAPRFIIIDKEGTATGHKGDHELGIVGKEFFDHRVRLFNHFGIKASAKVLGLAEESSDPSESLPESEVPVAPDNNLEADAPASLDEKSSGSSESLPESEVPVAPDNNLEADAPVFLDEESSDSSESLPESEVPVAPDNNLEVDALVSGEGLWEDDPKKVEPKSNDLNDLQEKKLDPHAFEDELAEDNDKDKKETNKLTDIQKLPLLVMKMQLQKELNSFPYHPLRARKQVKIEAINLLLRDDLENPLETIQRLRQDNMVTAGFFSTRTSKALEDLESQLMPSGEDNPIMLDHSL